MKSIRRGYLPEYEKTFRGQAIDTLREAVTDALFLLNRGHSLKRATTIAMEHYQLPDYQRLALSRGLASDAEISRRTRTKLTRPDCNGASVLLDGFNAIILMESLISESPIFLCMDGAVRDLANLKGSYHIIDKTERAIKLILDEMDSLNIANAHIHIDNPVSNSRNLKCLILELAQNYHTNIDVQLIDACDKSFYGSPCVISGDGVVIDNATSWIPLYAWIVQRYQQSHPVWLINFDELSQKYRNMIASAPLNNEEHS